MTEACDTPLRCLVAAVEAGYGIGGTVAFTGSTYGTKGCYRYSSGANAN